MNTTNVRVGVLAAFLAISVGPSDASAAAAAKVVVAVHLRAPEFEVMEAKYRVFYVTGEKKTIPLQGYDFKAALLDELLSVLAEDKRMEWRPAAASEAVDVVALYDGKALPPGWADVDRILLVDVFEYGVQVKPGQDQFFIICRMKLIARASGKQLWQEKRLFERIDLTGKLEELQVDNQKGLKEGMNRVLEKVCSKVAGELLRARF